MASRMWVQQLPAVVSPIEADMDACMDGSSAANEILSKREKHFNGGKRRGTWRKDRNSINPDVKFPRRHGSIELSGRINAC